MPRTTRPLPPQDTREERVSYVMTLLAEGHLAERHDRVLAARWGVAPSVAREVIAEARRAWRRTLDPEAQADLVQLLEARLDRVYRLGLRTNDLKASLGAIRERAALGGLYARGNRPGTGAGAGGGDRPGGKAGGKPEPGSLAEWLADPGPDGDGKPPIN